MLSYSKVQTKPRILNSLTGLTCEEFERLLPTFEAAWQEFIETQFINQARNRRYGGGRKPQLKEHPDKLLFILFYFRHYPTQELQGFLFSMSQAQTSEWVHRLTQVLNQALGQEQQLPDRNPLRLKAVLEACPELKFILDGAERSVYRPKEQEIKRGQYSDKKKMHQ